MCHSDPHGEFTGLNCLIERESVEATAAKFGLSVEETEGTLAKARQLLHERRSQRPRPHLDDKVTLLLSVNRPDKLSMKRALEPLLRARQCLHCALCLLLFVPSWS